MAERRSYARVALLSIFLWAAALLALAPALLALPLLSPHYDWCYFDTLSEIARRSVVWYREVPLWNPYSCGGEVDLANPQSLSAAPTFLLVLLFGTAPGIKLSLLVYYLLGLFGAFHLGRRLGASVTGAALGAVGFGLSGYQALHLAVGHLNFAGVCLYPSLLLFYDRSLDEIEWALPAGLFAAWVTALGGTFTPPLCGILLLFWAIVAMVERRSPRPLLLLLAIALLGLLFSAVRSLPVLQFITDHPRPPFRGSEPDVSSPHEVLSDLVAWRRFARVPGRRYLAHEYAAKVPYVLLPLFAAALLSLRRLPRPRAALGLLGLALFSLLVSMGHFSKAAPWPLLQHLPVFQDLRVPSRFEVLMVLPLALLAAFGWDALAAWLRPRLGARAVTALGVGVLCLATADGVLYTAGSFRGTFTVRLDAPPRPVRFSFVPGHWSAMRADVFSGHGTLGCDEEAPLQRAEALDTGEVPQQRLLDEGAGTIARARFSPNRRVVTVDLERDTVLLLNANWNEHFLADRGRLTQVAGRLAVDLAGLGKGRHTITVRYAPRLFSVGAAVSALSLPGGLLGFLLARRWRRRRAKS